MNRGLDLNPSQLLFGINLHIENGSLDSDTFLNNAQMRNGLQKVHNQIVRFPARGRSPTTGGIQNWPEFQKSAQIIKSLGMVPLAILRNPKDPYLLTDCIQIVNYMNSIFNGPDDVVYYELGNEPDSFWDAANQVDPIFYCQQWNAIIPHLKFRAPNARFIGPVNYHYNEDYTRTFLQNANPLPDFVSWHMYTCSITSTTEECLQPLANWTKYINATRSLMKATIGIKLPIMITEWNFNANLHDASGTLDSKVKQDAFVRAWTQQAIQTLADNQVFASMHYDVASLQPLADDNGQPTAQGLAFKDKYEEFFRSPPPMDTSRGLSLPFNQDAD